MFRNQFGGFSASTFTQKEHGWLAAVMSFDIG